MLTHVPATRSTEHVFAQKAALAFWTFHYGKRILETFFVHKCAGRGVSRGREFDEMYVL